MDGMKRVALAIVLLCLLGLAACGHDESDPVTSQRTPSDVDPDAEPDALAGDELWALWDNGEDQYIEYETLAANAELHKCLMGAGEDEAKRAACRAVFKARLRRVLVVVENAKATSEEQAPR